jgi:prepilin-type processing-associated H-X9-DG protein
MSLTGGKADIVWLDGHASGNLDSVWNNAFGSHRHVKHLKEGECFDRAVLVSAGYSSPLWFNNRSWRPGPCHETADAFADHVVKTHGLEGTTRIKKRVVIIDRKPYIAHPRSKKGMPRVIKNLHELEEGLRQAGGDVRVVDFAKLTFSEQLREVREADLLVGIHGAGLSHVMFMSDGATLVELATNSLGMFNGFANWRQRVNYKEIGIGGGDGDFWVSTDKIQTVATLLR